MKWIIALVLLLSVPALAAEPAQAPATPVEIRSVNQALQQTETAIEVLMRAYEREAAAQRRRIAELEKLCGDLCKP